MVSKLKEIAVNGHEVEVPRVRAVEGASRSVLIMVKKKVNVTKFSITTVSILTFVSLPLFDVLRLVAVGIVDFEGYMDMDSLLVFA